MSHIKEKQITPQRMNPFATLENGAFNLSDPATLASSNLKHSMWTNDKSETITAFIISRQMMHIANNILTTIGTMKNIMLQNIKDESLIRLRFEISNFMLQDRNYLGKREDETP
ncbi:2504_t:CDS:2 [Racocetra persica]|uniref:2504_t:CDS:1 n=1 Tax=Racocetra persica TaxID=160502 RepID=A0ACA9KR27_9GLOM|nr:2504_t:CDS:2 [Racocetra persica]